MFCRSSFCFAVLCANLNAKVEKAQLELKDDAYVGITSAGARKLQMVWLFAKLRSGGIESIETIENEGSLLSLNVV